MEFTPRITMPDAKTYNILDCGSNGDAISKDLVEQAVRTSRLRLAPKYIIKLRGLTDCARQQHKNAATLLEMVFHATGNIINAKLPTHVSQQPSSNDAIRIEKSAITTQGIAALKGRFSKIRRDWAMLSIETEHVYKTMGDASGELMIALDVSECAYYGLEKDIKKLEKEMYWLGR
jgi:hypothetical protein